MTEKDIFEKISESASQVELPEKIKPEQIKKVLEMKRKKAQRRKIMAASAAIFLCGSVFVSGAVLLKNQNQKNTDLAGTSSLDSTESATAQSVSENSTQSILVEEEDFERRDAGDLYIVAKSYDDYYEKLQQGFQETGETTEDVTNYVGESDVAVLESQKLNSTLEDSVSETAEYSETNLQTEGVDESDIIKTDGNYIYTVRDNEVVITDIQNGALRKEGTIIPELSSAGDSIREMYIDGKNLILIVQYRKSSLENTETTGNEKTPTAEEDVAYYDLLIDNIYYIDTNNTTSLLTYDISNPALPKLCGEVTQDGSYNTSRKIGNQIYLFTTKNSMMQMGTDVNENGALIPLVNGEKIASDSIYLSSRAADYTGYGEILVSSMDISKPSQVTDAIMIMNSNAQVYMSKDAFYLYSTDYMLEETATDIAKFGFENGKINAVGSASVDGTIRDTFAINESEGCLRLLTTSWSTAGVSENNLYLLDENMSLTGSLEKIAEGEMIYAARYIADTAYFVTYRNTDPLFAVDLSDKTNPTILSELKITGFSEYLHFWGEDKMLGIGYETDPDTGRQEGIKLTMFDISNPEDLTTLGTYVLKDVDYSSALYNYKSVLADAKENIIGFATETYENQVEVNYFVFAWEDSGFKNLLTEPLKSNGNFENYRGIYMGNIFYIASQEGISAYDRTAGYQFIEELVY